MAEGAARSLRGNEPHCTRSSRRPNRGAPALAALAGCTALAGLAATIIWKPPVLLVWNASASAPIGLYRLSGATRIRRGDMVIAWAPPSARDLAAERHYLPKNVPLVKRVAAIDGDRVCASGGAILINRRPVSRRRAVDLAKRPMPWWTGCRRLGRGDIFLLTDNPQSFDGRYFGITRGRELIGRAVLIWAKPAGDSRRG